MIRQKQSVPHFHIAKKKSYAVWNFWKLFHLVGWSLDISWVHWNVSSIWVLCTGNGGVLRWTKLRMARSKLECLWRNVQRSGKNGGSVGAVESRSGNWVISLWKPKGNQWCAYRWEDWRGRVVAIKRPKSFLLVFLQLLIHSWIPSQNKKKWKLDMNDVFAGTKSSSKDTKTDKWEISATWQ